MILYCIASKTKYKAEIGVRVEVECFRATENIEAVPPIIATGPTEK
jgi:hypothetical protein